MLILKNSFNRLCAAYIHEFERKQGITLDFWIGGDIGDFAEFQSYYVFTYNEIRYDIDNDIPKGIILEYFERLQDLSENKISYKNYVLNLRHKDVIESERKKSLEKSRESVNESRNYLYNEIDKMK